MACLAALNYLVRRVKDRPFSSEGFKGVADRISSPVLGTRIPKDA
jgi:hypothetical protein